VRVRGPRRGDHRVAAAAEPAGCPAGYWLHAHERVYARNEPYRQFVPSVSCPRCLCAAGAFCACFPGRRPWPAGAGASVRPASCAAPGP